MAGSDGRPAGGVRKSGQDGARVARRRAEARAGIISAADAVIPDVAESAADFLVSVQDVECQDLSG